MSVEISASIEKELREMAVIQSRDLVDLVEEAVRQYLEAASITDLQASDVGEAQIVLVGELGNIHEWKNSRS
jgi:predicted transcriptional regulator